MEPLVGEASWRMCIAGVGLERYRLRPLLAVSTLCLQSKGCTLVFLPQRAAAIPSPAVVDSRSGTGPQINSSSFKMLWVMVFYHSERQVTNSWTSVGCLEITSCELSDFVLLFLFCLLCFLSMWDWFFYLEKSNTIKVLTEISFDRKITLHSTAFRQP